jgi:hypothetical protein
MTSEKDERNEALAIELVEGGSDLAGAAAGAAIGLLGGQVGAVGGAAAGAVLGRVVRKVGADLKQRVLGPREEMRVGAAAAFAGATIQAYLNAGEQPRDDGFFEGSDDRDRPAAEELLEGVLLHARDAYEEKKVRLLGIMYAQFAFHADVTPARANHLLSLASQLTYRQLTVLAIASDEAQRQRLRDGDYRGDTAALEQMGAEGTALLIEIYDLYQRGLLSDGGGSAWISVGDVNPRGMRLQGSGAALTVLMGLSTISTADRESIYAMLS